VTDSDLDVGYALSSEEFGPNELADLAGRAEDVGFDFASISDHYHPWLDSQGESPFVWSTLGAISRTTETLDLGVGVTCPTMRIHTPQSSPKRSRRPRRCSKGDFSSASALASS